LAHHDARETGDHLGEKLHLFGDNVFVLRGEPGDVAARVSKTRHEALTGSTRRDAMTTGTIFVA
jgi:hypothetical protein